MTVIEVIRKYGLEDFSKSYLNQSGNSRNLIPLDKLTQMEVKGININFPTNEVTITIIETAEVKKPAKQSALIGRVAYIKNSIDSNSYNIGGWGDIIAVDEDGTFHIAMYGDLDDVQVFNRNEFVVHRKRG